MATLEAALETREAILDERRVVNDFSLQVATVNGSGSQTANNILMRALFQMGIPVSGKNLFPSNIEGLPTWFTLRVNKHGYVARKEEIDFMVCMNPETAREDVLGLPPGSAVLYDEPLKLDQLRGDLIFYSAPFDKLVGPLCPEAKLRKLVKNMLYPGMLAYLLGIEMPEMQKALRKQFGPRKVKAADLNWGAAQAAYDWAAVNLPKRDSLHVERMNANQGKVIIDGNAAAAIGCMFAGVTVVTWYPITPSSSLVESLIDYMKRFRIDPETRKATFAIVQAEDELASIGMVLGASWMGARAMTSTSGPGISLMSEFVGLGYYAEIPAVIFDVQRVGPSTGLPTRTAQGDILKNFILSHGDTKHVLLFPSSPEECYAMAHDAFDLAEQIQTPIFVMLDLDLGMNNWMADPFPYIDRPPVRGKVLSAEDLERIGKFERYRDVDGDAIPYRTLPGTRHPIASYFTRGSGHNEKAAYSEKAADYKNNMDRLSRKFETARRLVPGPAIHEDEGAEVAIVCVGTSHWATIEARDLLRAGHGMKTAYLRLKALPIGPDARAFLERYRRIYVIDQNRDGQLFDVLRLDSTPDIVGRLRSVRHYDGLPLPARTIVNQIVSQEQEKAQ